MKTFTLTSKIHREITLTITAEDWNHAEALILGIGLNLEDWDY